MKTAILAAAAAATLVGVRLANADEVEDLRKRVEKLEEANEKLTDRAAQAAAKAKSADWASKITWKGDFRVRHENIDAEEAVTDQTRERIRARFGLTAKVNDKVKVTVQLATNGGNGDPRSTNQTIGNGWDRKGLGIDQAYAEWTPVASFTAQLGKMPMPWQRVGSYFWDGDITPEGAAFKFSKGAFFANAFSMVLSERSAASDATLNGGQLGVKADLGGMKLTVAAGYYDVGAVEGKITTTAGACTANPAFFGGPFGNSTVTVGGCARLANDFNLLEGLAQAEFKLGSVPLTIFANYLQNQEAEQYDTALSAGFTIGKASDPHTWEIGYVYQKTEKDSQFAQFVDSDFAGNLTDADGSVLKLAYAIAKNWTVNGTYFKNTRFMDVGTERDYDRYQLDLNFKF